MATLHAKLVDFEHVHLVPCRQCKRVSYSVGWMTLLQVGLFVYLSLFEQGLVLFCVHGVVFFVIRCFPGASLPAPSRSLPLFCATILTGGEKGLPRRRAWRSLHRL